MKTRWKARAAEESSGTLLERVMAVRGQESSAYLNPSESDLYDPELIPDMITARDRVIEALDSHERICIYSDYDCDGTIGAAILIRYLKNAGADVGYYIPNRLLEGYGLNIAAIDSLKDTDLLITVDNGISSVEEAQYINKLGIDLIITDHHEPQERLPEALAVLDCKREDSKYPYRELCGAAVALKLVCALEDVLRTGYDLNEFYELVMISTVADIVPLIDENRTLVKLGLESFSKTGFIHRGLRQLYELSNVDELTSGVIGYQLAPAINAAGRLGEVDDVMDFLLFEDIQKATDLFQKNKRRMAIERELTDEAIKLIRSQKLYKNDIIVIGGKGWHTGVIGIVASRIQEYWYRPVIVIGYDEDGFGRGSCRSIKGFNIFEALSSTKEVFESFGGHSLAAGFSIERENVEQMIANLKDYTATLDMKELFIKEYEYDLELDPRELTIEEVGELSQMEPFGIGNPAPLFKFRIETVTGERSMGADKKHLSFNADGIRAVAFNKAVEFGDNLVDPLFILAKAEINCYNNRKKIQLNVKDIKLCPYYSFHAADGLLEDDPGPASLATELSQYDNPFPELNRPLLLALYNLIRKAGARGFSPQDYARLTGESSMSLAAGLHILSEAHLIGYKYTNNTLTCHLIPTKGKKDLTQTPTYKRMEQVREILENEL